MRLDLVVGPNGAGKSTLVELDLSRALPWGATFVNADAIAAQRWPDDAQAQAHAYEAAAIAAQTRAALIARRAPFIAETVFSHPSKLELITAAHDAGYVVALHVLAVPEELSVARVSARVAAGGHSVPEQKIRDRHRRLWPLVVRAIKRCDTSVVYDNAHRDGPREVARFADGHLVGAAPWPAWAPTPLPRLA